MTATITYTNQAIFLLLRLYDLTIQTVNTYPEENFTQKFKEIFKIITEQDYTPTQLSPKTPQKIYNDFKILILLKPYFSEILNALRKTEQDDIKIFFNNTWVSIEKKPTLMLDKIDSAQSPSYKDIKTTTPSEWRFEEIITPPDSVDTQSASALPHYPPPVSTTHTPQKQNSPPKSTSQSKRTRVYFR